MVIRRICLLVGALAFAPFHSASAHAIHMSYTEVRYAEKNKTLNLSIRVYANDFSAGAARRAGVKLGADSAIDVRSALAYIERNLQVVGADGRLVKLASCGVARSTDMLTFCFALAVPRGMNGMRMRNSMLTELFSDQVNVVQSVSGRGRTSRMFVRGDGWKLL